MEIVTEKVIEQYLRDDRIAAQMAECSDPDDETLTCQTWLQSSPAKRMIFDRLYSSLLNGPPGQRILDVGGGLTCFTRVIAARHHYELIDLMAHEEDNSAERFEAACGRRFIYADDWFNFEPTAAYDVVIANDLFPNVDQRLELFIEKFLPWAKEIRLSLTYYPAPRFYVTRRVVGEEILCMLAWDGEATARVMNKYLPRLKNADLDLFCANNTSVYPNGRQVCLAALRGDA